MRTMGIRDEAGQRLKVSCVDHHFFWMLSTSITLSNDFNERIWYDRHDTLEKVRASSLHRLFIYTSAL